MNGFKLASAVGDEGLRRLLPWFKVMSFDGRFVVTLKGPLSEFLQRTVGDLLFNVDSQTVWSMEIKTEKHEAQLSGARNLFLETWSNRSRFTPGWMYTLNADLLAYFFLDTGRLYVLNFRRLKTWAFASPSQRSFTGRLYDYQEKPQGKYVQLNDTWGRCVPIDHLAAELPVRVIEIPGEPEAEPRAWNAAPQQDLFA